jgi:hypothetical protein
VDPVLSSLLLDLTSLSDEEAERVTYQEYVKLYMDRRTHREMIGERRTHDGKAAVFYSDRFDHAFFTTSHRISRPRAKDKFDRNRASRVRWIGKVIEGEIANTECWCVVDPDTSARKRLYVLWDEHYLIWLNPRRQGGWKFSSAYTADRGYIRSKTKQGTCIWRKK